MHTAAQEHEAQIPHLLKIGAILRLDIQLVGPVGDIV